MASNIKAWAWQAMDQHGHGKPWTSMEIAETGGLDGASNGGYSMGVDNNPPAAVFAAALVAARREAGITTQAAFSRAAGISQVEANKYERGVMMPSLLRFARMTQRAAIDPLPILAALDAIDQPQEQA